MFRAASSSVIDWDQSYLQLDLEGARQHFIEHLQTTVTIIAKLLDLWSQKYENGAGKNSGHFVAVDIVIAGVAENLAT